MNLNVGTILRGYTLRQLVTRFAEEYVWWLIRSWPGFEGVWMRYLFLKLTTKRLGGFCWISQGCTIYNTYNLEIGRSFTIGRNVQIDAIGGIVIGDGAGIGPGTIVLSQEHSTVSPSGHFGKGSFRLRPVRIGERAWIGANCFVKAGVTIGDDAVVAACSNVIEDVPAKATVIGSPARSYIQAIRELRAVRPAP